MKEKQKNKIVYIGNFKRWWSAETYIAKSFEDLGWKVKRIQEDEFKPEDAIKECEDAKFLLWTRAWVEKIHLVEEVLSKIKIPSVSWHLDLYFGLDREKELKLPFWKCDYVFTADGGHQEEFKKLGINHYFLSPGVYKKDCYFGKKDKKWKGKDIVFLGSYYYHPEWQYRKVLIEWLHKTYKDKFALVGGDQVYFIKGSCWGKDKNNLFASVPIVMGDSLYSPNYWSDRLSESCGRGAFLIFPCIEGIEDEGYRYYKDFIPYNYGDFKTLKEIIDYYLIHPKEREEIRNSGMAFVKKYHTWENKIQYVLSVLEKNNWSKNPKYKYEDCLRPRIKR